MVSSGKKDPLPFLTMIYFMATNMTITTSNTTSRGFFLVRTVFFFVGAPFFFILICHESTCWKIMVLICGVLLFLSFSLCLRPYNSACPHSYRAHHSFSSTQKDIKHYNCSETLPLPSQIIRSKFIAPISFPGKLERVWYNDICSV